MTVCNFLLHGAVGEVVWHNSLLPDSWYGGWRVNKYLNNPFHKYHGIPHVETLKQENSFIYQSWKAQKEAAETKQTVIPEPVIFKVNKPMQLTLFDGF